MLNLNDEQRQTLTTWSMLGGAGVFTVLTGVLVWIIRWSWPKEIMVALAPTILDKLAWITFGSLGLVAVMIVTMATIAVGGRVKAKVMGQEFEAETDKMPVVRTTTETQVVAPPTEPLA